MNSNSEVIISKQNLLHNLRQFKKVANGAKIMTVVKANAYGHGLILTTQAVELLTDWFATVNLDEALLLRKSGIKKPILVLSYYDLLHATEAIKKNISLVVYDLKQAQAVDRAASKLGKKAKIHIKIDTGTSRLGVDIHELLNFTSQIKKFKNLDIEGVFSHLAASEEDLNYTKLQIDLFELALLELSKVGINPKWRHIACTASTMVLKSSRYNMVRIGIGFYGLSPSEKVPDIGLKPVLSWYTKIIQIRNLRAGTFVGYGKTYRTKRETKLAVLPVGYYEGYDRGFSNNSFVAINGKRCRVLGRICMNLMMVDVTDIKAKVGDRVELIGKTITADELAKRIGTINYEIVTRINSQIPRILKR